MLGLIERLEAAEVGEEGLSAELCVLFQYGGLNSEGATDVRTDAEWEGDLLFEQNGEDCCNPIPPVTTSLDAALALLERVLPGWAGIGVATTRTGWGAVLCEKEQDTEAFVTNAPTPALALCIVILRARSDLNTGSEAA